MTTCPTPVASRLRLETPSPDLLDDYIQACAETWGHVHNSYILHDPATAHEWRSHLLDDYRRQEQGVGLPDGFVPSRTLWLTRDGRYAGTVNIRLRLSPQLERYGGHVGIVIRLGLRGQGLGTIAFPLAIAEAHRLGIREVLATCEADNTPSRRMLLHAGPTRTERRRADIEGVERDVCHFWYVV
ncbi:MAG: GNAT family N-acetyltransferase [Oligosphaeraceae bacterium]